MTAHDPLELALSSLQAGDLHEAERLCHEALTRAPNDVNACFILGTTCQAANRLKEARDWYVRTIELAADFPEAHNNLGVVLEGLGRLPDSLAAYLKAVEINPNYVEALNNLGGLLTQLGRPDEGIAHCQKATGLQPTFAQGHNNLGLALAAQKKWHLAVACFRTAIRIMPSYSQAHNNLGNVLARIGTIAEAETAYRAAISLNPLYAEAFNNLALLYRRQSQFQEALVHYERALALRPDYPEALNNLGELHERQGRLERAEELYRTVLRHKPDYASAWNNLGIVLRASGRVAESVAACERAVLLKPTFAEAFSNLGVSLLRRGALDEAVRNLERAVELKPQFADAHGNLGNAYRDQGRQDEAIQAYERAVALKPVDAALHSNLIYALHFHPNLTPEQIFNAHRRWAERHEIPVLEKSRRERPSRSLQRCRIGYVSADFRDHVMGFYIEPVLAAHDRDQFELYCYSSVTRPDAATHRMRQLADHWRDLVGLSDDEAADRIRNDGIDLLIDLSGHTAGNRLLVFARRPAWVQATHFGYWHSTGMASLDYRLCDAHASPPGMMEHLHTENLARLPEIGWCFVPPELAMQPAPPAARTGRITFGSFNNLAKITPELIAVWSRILLAVRGSRLLLLSGADGRLIDLFNRNGVHPNRLHFEPRKGRTDYLQSYAGIDICLDTYPFTGCNTTADALWMGVPVVTMAGRTPVTRQSTALLMHLGLGEWIATDYEDYVARVIRLAETLGIHVRRYLRERMRASTFTNPRRFVLQLEQVYREILQAGPRKLEG
ncbi:MAG: tetratricopeptide repeat protein [Gemmataceae bacterium]